MTTEAIALLGVPARPSDGVYRFHTRLGLITVEPNGPWWRAMWSGHKYRGEDCCLNSVARSPRESADQASEWLESVEQALRANGLYLHEETR